MADAEDDQDASLASAVDASADAEDDLGARLAAVVEGAAPAVASTPHLGEVELVQIRRGSEAPSLDASYRHLATCASCRARLVEFSADAGPARKTASAAERAAPRRRVLTRGAAWVAAAVTLLAIGYAVTQGPHAPEQLTIVQRPYAGMMGSQAPEAIHENTNLELAFTADAEVRAFVLPCDEAGKSLSAPRWFTRESSGRSVVVLAPRTFPPHSGKAFGLVVWGTDATLRQLAEQATTLAPAETRQALTKLVADRGARMQWLPLVLQ